MRKIGKRIKDRREELGLSQEELAQRLGYKNKSSIAKIEAGINDIVLSKAEAFAKALETNVFYLMGWVESPEESPGEPPEAPEPITQNYYINDESAAILQELYENEDKRILLDATKDVSPDDLKNLINLVRSLGQKKRGDID